MPLKILVESEAEPPLPDVQQTTFSVDALARFICNTWSEAIGAQGAQPFDVIVYTRHVFTQAHIHARNQRPSFHADFHLVGNEND